MGENTNFREIKREPPKLDESWWRAVLSEEDRYQRSAVEIQSQNGLYNETEGTSTEPSDSQINWDIATKLYNSDEMISLNVIGFNRGGLLVNGNGIHGFVPISHLVNCIEEEVKIDQKLQSYIDKTIRLKIIECDPERGRVVFSERAAQSKPGKRIELLGNLKAGEHTFGTVTNITDFGVFVDLGGIEGLIHVSELSWGRVNHPADVVHLDERIEVYVLQVDFERSRVALSLKQLHPNPWQIVEMKYEPGQVTEAVITSIVPFGAFARLEEGLDGLIHITEMDSEGEISHPEEVLEKGQIVKVRILHVDSTRQRLGLSLNLSTVNDSEPEDDESQKQEE